MTTQARELAGLMTNAGDLHFADDIHLLSDGGILNFGADNDVTLTHVADTGLLLNSTRRLQFGDSGTYINQSADGVLNLTSDTEVEINATTVDINANVDISGNLVLGGNITIGDADSDSLTLNADLTSHLIPNATNTYDLGTSSKEWRNAYFDGTVTSDAFAGPLTGDVTGNVSGTAATVTTAAQTNITSLGTLSALTVSGNTQSGTFSAGSSSSASELLYLLGSGHTGHGASNTVSLASIAESTSGNIMGLWFGSMTNENTGVIGSRTASGNIAFQTYTSSAWGERMRITSAGRVGIGTASPSYPLSVELDASSTWLSRFYNTGTTEGDNGLLVRTGSEHDGTITLGAYSGSSYKFVVNGDGTVGIGTGSPGDYNSAADNLVVVSSADTGISIVAGTSNDSTLMFADGTGGTAGYRGRVSYDHASDYMRFDTAAAERMRITSAGHVTVGSGANVGTAGTLTMNVGTTSTSGGLQLFSPDSAAHGINFGDAYSSSAVYAGYIEYNHPSNYMRFGTGATERLRILSTGDVLIGQTSQTGYTFAEKLVVGDGDANDGITIQSGSTHQGNLAFNHSDGTTAHGRISYQHNTNLMSFFTNNVERMRITDGHCIFAPETGSNGDYTMYVGTVNAGGTGNRYAHVAIGPMNGSMYWFEVVGHDYVAAILEGRAGGYYYNTGATTTPYSSVVNGSISTQYQTASGIELVIDTGATGTSNRWGSVTIRGGTDTISANTPLEIIQYSYTSTTTKVY